MGRYSSRVLGDDFDSTAFFTNLVNDAAAVAKVAETPTTNISSMVSPTGVQTYSYSAPAGSVAAGVPGLTGTSSSGLLLLGGLALVAVMLLRH